MEAATLLRSWQNRRLPPSSAFCVSSIATWTVHGGGPSPRLENAKEVRKQGGDGAWVSVKQMGRDKQMRWWLTRAARGRSRFWGDP